MVKCSVNVMLSFNSSFHYALLLGKRFLLVPSALPLVAWVCHWSRFMVMSHGHQSELICLWQSETPCSWPTYSCRKRALDLKERLSNQL